MAGSPCPVEVMKRVQSEMHMGEVTICYGMTETSPVSTQTKRGDAAREAGRRRSAQVHPHIEVKVVDPTTGRTLPRGETGELCTRGYSVMLGYWDDARRRARRSTRRGWMHTGDLAVMDEEGYVNIVGRIKDMIIRGGENIYPREIEEFLYTHPGDRRRAGVRRPRRALRRGGVRLGRPRDGRELDEEELREFCRGKIARYKVPRYVRFVDGFPLTVTGKVAEVPHARARDRRARARRRRRNEDGLACRRATRRDAAHATSTTCSKRTKETCPRRSTK